MATQIRVDLMTAGSGRIDAVPSGPAMAAFLAAGIGAFAMGLIAVHAAAGWLPVPALYAPAGGVSGRTTLAVVVWLVAWGVLHRRWRFSHVDVRRVGRVTLALIVVGIIGTFPPVWELF
ncbi:MAG: hypothetical protein WD942_10825 [Dehalococcoidia bacterium]